MMIKNNNELCNLVLLNIECIEEVEAIQPDGENTLDGEWGESMNPFIPWPSLMTRYMRVESTVLPMIDDCWHKDRIGDNMNFNDNWVHPNFRVLKTHLKNYESKSEYIPFIADEGKHS